MRLILPFLLLISLFSCSDSEKSPKSPSPSPVVEKVLPRKKQSVVKPTMPSPVSKYSVATFLQPEGWGYYISENGKQIINQQTIPGVPGNQGFKTSEEALKVAELVRSKMENGTFPPTISEEELQKLGISWRN